MIEDERTQRGDKDSLKRERESSLFGMLRWWSVFGASVQPKVFSGAA